MTCRHKSQLQNAAAGWEWTGGWFVRSAATTDGGLLPRQFQVTLYHQASQLLQRGRGFPAEFAIRLRRITQQQIDLCRSKVPGIDFYEVVGDELKLFEHKLCEAPYRLCFTGRENKIFRLIVLQH
jgi:hypothetical protein